MKIGSLLQYNSLDGKTPLLLGLILAFDKIHDEKVATVLWSDGIVAHWRYEHFPSTDEECRIEVCQ